MQARELLFSCIRSSDLNESDSDASMEYGVRSKESNIGMFPVS